jgi:hypothetical protein
MIMEERLKNDLIGKEYRVNEENKNNFKCLLKGNLCEDVDEDNPDDCGDAHSLKVERVDLANHWGSCLVSS